MVKPKPGFLTLRTGKWRGKKIPVPGQESVRPTTDRVRVRALALIDQHFRHPDGRARWTGARVLDAFAGTGALGLEAASRGAASVQLWDIEGAQLRMLLDIAKGFPRVTVRQLSALRPPFTPQPRDLIFLDPPYRKGLVDRALACLNGQGWIASSTLVYAETEAGSTRPQGFHILTERMIAGTCLRLLKTAAQTDP